MNSTIIKPASRDVHTVRVIRPDEIISTPQQELMAYIEKEKCAIDSLPLTPGALHGKGISVENERQFLQVKESFSAHCSPDYVDNNSLSTRRVCLTIC